MVLAQVTRHHRQLDSVASSYTANAVYTRLQQKFHMTISILQIMSKLCNRYASGAFSTVILPRAGRPKNRGTIPSRVRDFSPQNPDQFWAPFSHPSKGYTGVSPAVK
jgi:hypothetical protein